MKTVLVVKELTCPGCTCGTCAGELISTLRSRKGIVEVKPDFFEKTIEIEYLEAKINEPTIINLIKSMYYEVD